MLSIFVNFFVSPLTLYNCYCIFDYLIYKRDFEWRTLNEKRRNLNVFFVLFLSFDRFFIRFLFLGILYCCCNLPHHLYWCSSLLSMQGWTTQHGCCERLDFYSRPSLVFYWGENWLFFVLNYSFTCIFYFAPFTTYFKSPQHYGCFEKQWAVQD